MATPTPYRRLASTASNRSGRSSNYAAEMRGSSLDPRVIFGSFKHIIALEEIYALCELRIPITYDMPLALHPRYIREDRWMTISPVSGSAGVPSADDRSLDAPWRAECDHRA